ncbi:cytochrome c [Marinicella litoralis]|uniref:Mono/diheme cytochrome c family protein n=1 Tax=Marinicella litoralis TaxID=644220 RepID=A0A4R6XUR9_9GAMM|nr:cytochrome c [Marinicella litoralis]TDR23755.1 mono/diheme cytochrome c family protein [Marinicella litoralis]
MKKRKSFFAKWLGRIFWVLILGVLAYSIYAYNPSIEPMAANSLPTYDPAVIERGRQMAAAGYCAVCHTEQGGAPYAGNYAMETGFGTIYSTNITPDREQGIGRWSEAAFTRAMREGVDREGRHLFPAFPYNHFAKMSEQDIVAIYAYIMTQVQPVQVPQRNNELPFPLNWRYLQAGWKLISVDLKPYQPDPEKSALWNRGAYLVEGVTHCGACHTPRNAVGAERNSDKFEGAIIDDWVAPALSANNESSLTWSAAEFSEYLKTGATRQHGVAVGPMAPVVHAGLRELSDKDLTAIGIYLADSAGSADSEATSAALIAASLEQSKPRQSHRWDTGERLYATACASCHYNAEQIALGRPELGINSAIHLKQPDNLIHVMLDGVDNQDGIAGVVMPGFRDALSDQEMALIAAYVRSSRTDKTPWPELQQKITEIRKSTQYKRGN